VIEHWDDGLRDRQPDVALEAVAEAAQEMLPWIAAVGDVDYERSILIAGFPVSFRSPESRGHVLISLF
jgi:hypothetical protein